ncbi:MAG: DUF1501 domain-containing protein [Pirellulales bacterium]
MFDVVGKRYRQCDGVTRRSMLKVGALAAGSLTLADALRARSHGGEGLTRPADTAVIQIFLGGGPSHLDTFDLKPTAPREIRGEFREIATCVPGFRVSEHLPRLAAVMDKFTVVRSVTHTNTSHLPSSHFLQTGYNVRNAALHQNQFPSMGSIVARLRGANTPGLPAYTAVPRVIAFPYASHLGAAYNPFTTEVGPDEDDFHVKNLRLVSGISRGRLQDRDHLRQTLDTMRRDVDLHGASLGMDAFDRAAVEMITSDAAAEAFNIEAEDPRLRDRYGRTSIGQNCLLARRLVEAGVTYVTCLSGGEWDTHTDNFKTMREFSSPRIDQSISALITDLYDRGLERRVLVNVMGEFGRSPRINADAGRDHWPGAMSVLFAGGDLVMGGMIGTTDRQGAYPTSTPYSPGDVLATMYRVLGIDTSHVFYDRQNRPIPVLPEGEPIAELFG